MGDDVWFSDPGEPREIFLRDGLVHRTPQPWTPTVAEVLLHLERVGFAGSPRHRGYDDQGRELLTFLPGEDGPVSWGFLQTDEGLASVAVLLRAYHDAVAGHRPDDDATWADSSGGPADGEVLCHGDPAPWNVVWQDGRAVGLIDWDFVHPADPMSDICYAMDWAVPFRDDETCRDFHHVDQTPDRARRVRVFLQAYGVAVVPPDVAARVAGVRRRTARTAAALAERGLEPQVGWVAGGLLEHSESVSRWIEENAALFVSP